MRPLKHLLTAGLLASLGFTAIAQTQTPPQPPTGAGAEVSAHRGGMGMLDPAKRLEMRQLRIEHRLAGLKLKLNISGTQEGAFSTWATAMRPNAQPQRPDRAAFEQMSTPERIDRMRALRATRITEMDRRMEATNVFYGALGADQRKVFDGESMKLLRGGGGGRGGHGDGPGRQHG